MYKLKIHRQVAKKLQKLSPQEYQRISKVLQQFAKTGTTRQVKKLSGKYQGSYRLRIGDWRILFIKDDKKKIISLLYFGSRGDIY
ncbi:MAG TPA: type II toxin-antitoxin system RelE/ParE family toxin [Nevskiaceae bacterium]|nr:type II toxin-antitoxin system RelE/ParE family toxin [Nevskiaceae bacterium]